MRTYKKELWFKALKEMFSYPHATTTISRILNHYNVYQPDAERFFQENKQNYSWNLKLREDKTQPVISKEVMRHLEQFQLDVLAPKKNIIELYLLWMVELSSHLKKILIELFSEDHMVQAYRTEIKECAKTVECSELNLRRMYFKIFSAFEQLIVNLLQDQVNKIYQQAFDKPTPLIFSLNCTYHNIVKQFEEDCVENADYQKQLAKRLEDSSLKSTQFILIDFLAEYILGIIGVSESKLSKETRISYQATIKTQEYIYIDYFKLFLVGASDDVCRILLQEFRIFFGESFREEFFNVFDMTEGYKDLLEHEDLSLVSRGIVVALKINDSLLISDLTARLANEISACKAEKVKKSKCLESLGCCLSQFDNIYLQLLLIKVRLEHYLLTAEKRELAMAKQLPMGRVGLFPVPVVDQLGLILQQVFFKGISAEVLAICLNILKSKNTQLPKELQKMMPPILSLPTLVPIESRTPRLV